MTRITTPMQSNFISELDGSPKLGSKVIHFTKRWLCMFGIPIEEGHSNNTFCDNEIMVKNSTMVASMVHKKHNLVASHYVC